MYVLDAGGSVIQLRFLPDGRRLLAGVASPKGAVTFGVWTLPGGGLVRLPLPALDIQAWWHSGYGSATAVHPSGEWCYLAWAGRLFSFRTADGSPRPLPKGVRAHQVVLSPRGDRLLAAQVTIAGQSQLSALTVDTAGDAVVWKKVPPKPVRLAGFLPDGERFVALEDVVRIRSFATGDEQAAGRVRPGGAHQPQLSPDGRHLGAVGYSNMYLFDTATLGKPRKIASSSGNFGNFVSYAFHPGGRTLAVIHGGPTLVKLYDLETLQRTQAFAWKLGPLESVAFSPDGTLGAAGARDGRIVVWDVDE
jgi:hypothetical protein